MTHYYHIKCPICGNVVFAIDRDDAVAQFKAEHPICIKVWKGIDIITVVTLETSE